MRAALAGMGEFWRRGLERAFREMPVHETMPAYAGLLEIGPDYVLGLHIDEMDMWRVRLYHLERESPIMRR